MEIKTLAEILAESDADSASNTNIRPKKPSKHSYKDTPNKPSKTGKRSAYPSKEPSSANDSINHDSVNQESTYNVESFDVVSSPIKKPLKYKKRKKNFHPAANFTAEPNDVPVYQPPEAQSIKEMLAEVKHNVHGDRADIDFHNKASVGQHLESSECLSDLTAPKDSKADSQIDNLPSALKAYLRTPEQRQAEVDAIKAESRLRWLAFYYLSRREYGKAELKQKLIDKEQDSEKIDALLDEFEDKGYQSDYRTTLMLIRESIRKGRGRGHIKQEFYRKKITMPDNIDELIDMANTESEEFSEFIDDSADSLVEGVDWLKLAVTARTKKYGDDIPTEQKNKAKQLRFLQYRGFNTDICFQALNYTLDNLDERF
ncbi:regulatory protein RecX [Psychrobacter sp. DAB_AL32B]|uniref:regulatory protein RecX n=1 Tax=Psychrobacter sp. DAB_AL32B TaxID=1028414 RepID=UPI000B7E7D79|nr:regulatory protein RecX [Psychrobacter sp. DAB_AL32B]OXL27153.1 inhibitor/regulator of recA, recX [Psychrobacter sp. DAB_AL32B]